MDDEKKASQFTLVADNSSTALEERRTQREFEYSRLRATDAIKRLTINLLRILAGAGEPSDLQRNLIEAHASYLAYSDSAKIAGRPALPPIEELDLRYLFSPKDEDHEPKTEEAWLRWAQPVSPYDQYLEVLGRNKLELRRAALRQVASALTTGDLREPHLKAHGGNLSEIIQRILDTKIQFEKERTRSVNEADPYRRAIAEKKIAEIKLDRRLRQLEALPAHQVAALRAVEAKSVDHTDRFTLDVLGGMKLLERPKRSTKKSDWQLTEDGRLALQIHKKREGEAQT